MMFTKKQIRTIVFIASAIAITQYFVRHFIIGYFCEKTGIGLLLSHFHFFLLVLASMLISVAAYLQILYYNNKVRTLTKDCKDNALLNPEKIYNFSFVLDIAGCLAGIFVAWRIGFLNLGFLFVMVATLFYFYALRYKRLFFWGNFCVTLIPLLSIGFVWLFEYFAIRQQPLAFTSLMVDGSLKFITWILVIYSFILGVLLYLWQIISQTQAWQENSLAPTVAFADKFGLKKAKFAIGFLLILLVAGLLISAIVGQTYFDKYIVWGNALFFAGTGFFVLIKLFGPSTKQDYLLFLNILIVLGIWTVLSMPVFYFVA